MTVKVVAAPEVRMYNGATGEVRDTKAFTSAFRVIPHPWRPAGWTLGAGETVVAVVIYQCCGRTCGGDAGKCNFLICGCC